MLFFNVTANLSIYASFIEMKSINRKDRKEGINFAPFAFKIFKSIELCITFD